MMTGTADKCLKLCVMFEDPAVYWLDSHRLIAVFKALFGVRIVVWRGRLVMGLVLFFLLNQLWMEVRSYEYPSVVQTPRKHSRRRQIVKLISASFYLQR